MGTTEEQTNVKKTPVEQEVSTDADSKQIEQGESSDPQDSSKEQDTPKEVTPARTVDTIYLDDSKVGIRFDNYPLSPEVIKALGDGGHQYLSRYQQTILDALTLGLDRWFSVNLSSNRGLIIGTYLVDLAQTDLTKTTSILCVAVPKIRGYFERDLLSIAKYTGVKILSVEQELPEDIHLEETPNIVIASIEMVARLQEQLNLSDVEVLYFDEVEKTIRDAEDVFVDFVNGYDFPQVVLQSSYYSDGLIQSVHRCKPDLDPARLYKQHNNVPAIYRASTDSELATDEQNWQTMLELVLPKTLLSRVVILTSDGTSVNQWLQTQGWDAIDTTQQESIAPSVIDGLRDNRVQLVLTNEQLFLATNALEFDVLISIDKITEDEEDIVKKNRRASLIVLCDYPDPTFHGIEVRALSDFNGCFNRSDSVIHSLRQDVIQELSTDWTDMVGDILDEVDGRQLLGEALRLALQLKRSRQGYIRSTVYKLENKDVFQRRNRKRSR